MTTVADQQAAWMVEYAEALHQHIFRRPVPKDVVLALRQIANRGEATIDELRHVLSGFPELLESPARTTHAAMHGLLAADDFPSHFRLGWTDADALASFPRRADGGTLDP